MIREDRAVSGGSVTERPALAASTTGSPTISFELQISVKRDPAEAQSAPGTNPRADATTPVVMSVAVNGGFSEAAYLGVMNAVTRLCASGAESVFVDMQDITLDDAACLERFAADVMSQRAAGCQLQVVARQASVHESLSALRGSRDWLTLFGDASVIGRRRAIHVDRHGEERP